MSELVLDVTVDLGGFSLAVRESVPLEGITAVFGPSGAGKTTLLRIVAGLERTASGRVVVSGDVWQDARQRRPAHKRGVGYVFQDGRLFPHLDVQGNLDFAVRHTRRRGSIAMPDVVEALDLEPLLPRRPGSLSGGEQQRVAIGRALLTSPRLLLMDEPLSSLDAPRKKDILRYIAALPERFSLPILYVTHSVDEVGFLADRVMLLGEGRVAGHGRVEDVLEDVRTWALTGRQEAGAVIKAVVEAHADGLTELSIGDQRLRVPRIDAAPGAGTRLRIQARDVVIATAPPTHLSIRNTLAARILAIDVDETIYVELLLAVGAQHLRARITRDALSELALAEGQDVYALIKSVAFEHPFA